MHSGDAVENSRHRPSIIGALPETAIQAQAQRSGAVHITKGPGFILAIAPPDAEEGPHSFAQFLLSIHTETVFGAICSCSGDVALEAGSVNRLLVTAHMGAV